MNRLLIMPVAAAFLLGGSGIASAVSTASFMGDATAVISFAISGDGIIDTSVPPGSTLSDAEGTGAVTAAASGTGVAAPLSLDADVVGSAASPSGFGLAVGGAGAFGVIEAFSTELVVTVDYTLTASGSVAATATGTDFAGAFVSSDAFLFISSIDAVIGATPILDVEVFGGAELPTDLLSVFPSAPYDLTEALLGFTFTIPAGSLVEFDAGVSAFGSAAVAPIPLPASGFLLIGGLAALAAKARRRG